MDCRITARSLFFAPAHGNKRCVYCIFSFRRQHRFFRTIYAFMLSAQLCRAELSEWNWIEFQKYRVVQLISYRFARNSTPLSRTKLYMLRCFISMPLKRTRNKVIIWLLLANDTESPCYSNNFRGMLHRSICKVSSAKGLVVFANP